MRKIKQWIRKFDQIESNIQYAVTSTSFNIFGLYIISEVILCLKVQVKINFLDMNLSITNGIVFSKIYDKRGDFNFEIVNFPFLDGDVPRSPSYGVYISQLIRFARVCSNVDDFNNKNLFLPVKLLKQGYRYHKIRKAFFLLNSTTNTQS